MSRKVFGIYLAGRPVTLVGRDLSYTDLVSPPDFKLDKTTSFRQASIRSGWYGYGFMLFLSFEFQRS